MVHGAQSSASLLHYLCFRRLCEKNKYSLIARLYFNYAVFLSCLLVLAARSTGLWYVACVQLYDGLSISCNNRSTFTLLMRKKKHKPEKLRKELWWFCFCFCSTSFNLSHWFISEGLLIVVNCFDLVGPLTICGTDLFNSSQADDGDQRADWLTFVVFTWRLIISLQLFCKQTERVIVVEVWNESKHNPLNTLGSPVDVLNYIGSLTVALIFSDPVECSVNHQQHHLNINKVPPFPLS